MSNDEQNLDVNQSKELEQNQKEMPEISLSAPWDNVTELSSEPSHQRMTGSFSSFNPSNNLDPNNLEKTQNVHNHFITERTRLHKLYIREQSRNKRISLILSFILIIAAALIVVKKNILSSSNYEKYPLIYYDK